MSIAALAFVVLASMAALVLPWVGVLTYYLFSVMQIQYLWPTQFGTGRIQLIITGATILGLAGATALKMVDWRRLLTPFSLLMFLFVINVNVSAHFSRFDDFTEATIALVPELLSSEEILSVFNKTLLVYFVACLLIDTRKKLEYGIYVLAGILLFYSLWANKVYLTGEFWLFGNNGRLGGPLGSNYFDENYLAMLYVLATPVLYYIGVARESLLVRYAIWIFIPLTWHALFLTSSRGGMLSLAVVCTYLFFRSFDNKASVAMVVGLVLAVVFQGGLLLTRVDTTIEATERLEQLPEQKLDPRLISWRVATEIMREYPLLGVGVGNFFHAFPKYSNTHPHVAHNTYFQISADSGVFAGLIYLYLFAVRIPTFKRSADINGTRDFPRGFSRDYIDDLLNSLLLGLFMVAIFLDLMIYEIVYFIIALSFSKYNLDRARAPKTRKMIHTIYRQSVGPGNSTHKPTESPGSRDTLV